MRDFRSGRAALPILAVLVVAIGGCSGESAVDANSDVLTPSSIAGIDPALDTGPYDTIPRDHSAGDAAPSGPIPVSTAHRLADHIVHPHDIDPALSEGSASTGVQANGTGFRTSRTTPDTTRSLTVEVRQFPSVADAVHAADEFHSYHLDPRAAGDDLDPGTPEHLPELPGTRASSIDSALLDTRMLSTWTPHDTYLIEVNVVGPVADADRATDTAVRAVRAQVETLDRMVREADDTAPDDGHVLGRTVTVAVGEGSVPSDLAVYGRQGWLHFVARPGQTRALLESTGTDRIATAHTTVHRTAGGAEAESLREGLTAVLLEDRPELQQDAAPPQGLPGTTCFSGETDIARTSVCFMVHGRYVAEIRGARVLTNDDPAADTLRTLSQRAAAQHVLFVRADELWPGEN